MSLEAMEWVWEHARARGVARMVLLAIAYRAPGVDCTAYAGTTMLVHRCGAARSSVVRAVDTLLASGELAVLDGTKGPRGERYYQLPHAAAHLHNMPPSPGFGGPVTGGPTTPPVAPSDRRTSDRTRSVTGPQGADAATGRGSSAGPPHQIEDNQEVNSASARTNPSAHEHGRSGAEVPDGARFLVEALAEAGLAVTWRLSPSEWATVCAAEQRWGREALVQVATERTAGRDVRSARYLLAIWRDAANFASPTPASQPAAGTGGNVVPLRRTGDSTSDNLLAGLALLEAREESAQ